MLEQDTYSLISSTILGEIENLLFNYHYFRTNKISSRCPCRDKHRDKHCGIQSTCLRLALLKFGLQYPPESLFLFNDKRKSFQITSSIWVIAWEGQEDPKLKKLSLLHSRSWSPTVQTMRTTWSQGPGNVLCIICYPLCFHPVPEAVVYQGMGCPKRS